jgi:membrane carboxypeptidase/penicillin-binding protein PbpC
MYEEGFISFDEMEKAKAEKITFALNKTDIRAPHFVMYVKEKLVEMYGEQMVEQGGLHVITTLDINIQEQVQKVVRDEVENLSKLQVSNGAALITLPSTGEVIAMVGSKDYFNNNEDGQVNLTISPRQPGSAIKPVNYAVALENGFTAATILEDSPSTFIIQGQPPYSPRNYDNAYHGKITLRQALANSYNVPAVKTLAKFGVENMIEKGVQMGIKTWNDRSRFGLSLTLGGGEVTMTDLAEVYGSLANNGYHLPLQPILKVSNPREDTLFSYHCQTNNLNPLNYSSTKFGELLECNPSQVVKPEVAFILSDILADNDARSQAFGSHSVLNIPHHHVAVKTGTTQNLRDNWTIGYTPNFLVATWVGNNDNSSMSYIASGITGASPIWNKIMTMLLVNSHDIEIKPPESMVQIEICPYTGTLPCEGCPKKKEFFIKGTEPKSACTPASSSVSKPISKTNSANLQFQPILAQNLKNFPAP